MWHEKYYTLGNSERIEICSLTDLEAWESRICAQVSHKSLQMASFRGRRQKHKSGYVREKGQIHPSVKVHPHGYCIYLSMKAEPS